MLFTEEQVIGSPKEAEVMAIYQVVSVKFGERGKMLRAVGFDLGEPMQ